MPTRVHRGSDGPDQRLANWLYSRACLPCRDGGEVMRDYQDRREAA